MDLDPRVGDIANMAVWVVSIIYFVGLLPQIFLNYKLKTAKGLSDLMIYGYFVGYLTQWLYAFFLGLPLAYQVTLPLGLLAVMVLVFQSLYYNEQRRRRFYITNETLIRVYMFTMLFAVMFFPLGVKYPDMSGYICGWVSAVIWAIYLIPQGVKMYVEKSVKGFSFAFATIMAIGVSIEFVSALILRLPLPTILTSLRGILAYIIFCVFFYKYGE